MQALAIESVDQRLEHMGLADHFAERAWTPLTCKNLITHRKPSREESKSGLILAEHGANCIRCAESCCEIGCDPQIQLAKV
ncbi:hypothetical protein D9M68_935530 [compost metagenome]